MFILKIILTIIITIILQSVIMPHFAIGGVVANTSIATLVSFSFLLNKKTGKYIGLFLGLLQDILFSPIVGINALIYFILGLLMERVDERVARDNYLMFSVIVIISTFLYNLFFYIIMFFLGSTVSLMTFIKNKLWIEIIYNVIIAIPIYLIMTKVFQTPEDLFTRK